MLAGNDFDADAAVITVVSAHPVGTEGFDADLIAAHSQAASRLDPAQARLVQVTLVTGADDAGRIVVVIHHLGVDAVSWQAIIEDLMTLWAQHEAGHE